MILTDVLIREAVQAGQIVLEPFDANQIQGATYDLRVGSQAVTTSSKEVRNLEEKGFVTFEAGDFGFVTTMEIIKLDAEHAARFGLRSGFARKGLIATTGPQIDPGFDGRLIIGLSNLTPNPIAISHGDDLVSVEFHKLPRPAANLYRGPYQGVRGLRPEDIALVTEKKGMLLSEIQETHSSLSSNVSTLTNNVSNLAGSLRGFEVAVGIAVGLLGVFIAVVALLK
jgi:dCTP deaminase